jgi:hypothetical protein
LWFQRSSVFRHLSRSAKRRTVVMQTDSGTKQKLSAITDDSLVLRQILRFSWTATIFVTVTENHLFTIMPVASSPQQNERRTSSPNRGKNNHCCVIQC